MKFGSTTIPEALFDLARTAVRTTLDAKSSITPAELRHALAKQGAESLRAISGIETNQRIVAQRITIAVLQELRASNEIAQLKRGVWVRPALLAAGG